MNPGGGECVFEQFVPTVRRREYILGAAPQVFHSGCVSISKQEKCIHVF